MPEKKLHEKLWQENIELAHKSLNHPFVQGIASGKLDMAAFKIYVAQDAFYLRAFRKSYALAIAKSDNLEHAKIFHNLMAGVLDELNLHKQYSAKLGIDLENVKPLKACSSYTNFLLRVAWQNSVGEIISAMTPCMILYAFIGKELSKNYNPNSPYKDWIITYSSQEFQALSNQMENLLDEIAQDIPAVRDNYKYAMQLEYEFFDVPMKM